MGIGTGTVAHVQCMAVHGGVEVVHETPGPGLIACTPEPASSGVQANDCVSPQECWNRAWGCWLWSHCSPSTSRGQGVQIYGSESSQCMYHVQACSCYPSCDKEGGR